MTKKENELYKTTGKPNSIYFFLQGTFCEEKHYGKAFNKQVVIIDNDNLYRSIQGNGFDIKKSINPGDKLD